LYLELLTLAFVDLRHSGRFYLTYQGSEGLRWSTASETLLCASACQCQHKANPKDSASVPIAAHLLCWLSC